MRLVIEDDTGAAWYVIEEFECVDLTSETGIRFTIDELLNTMKQIEEESYDPRSDEQNDDDPVDDIDPNDDSILDTDLMDENFEELDRVVEKEDYD